MRRKLPRYVNGYVDHTGTPRFYLRRKGQRNIPLPGLPWSPQFMAAYEKELAGSTTAVLNHVKHDSIEALVHEYLKSDTFKRLAAETQRTRKNILLQFSKEYGTKRYNKLRREHVVSMFEEKQSKRFAARNWLKTVHALMQYAMDRGKITEDPTAGVKNLSGKTTGYLTWPEETITQYKKHHPIGTVARLAIELLLNIAARRFDAHLLGQQHISNGKICWRPNKTVNSTNKLLKVRILPDLQQALDAVSKDARADGVLTFIVNEYGRPFASAAAFGNRFADWREAAGIKPVVCEDKKIRGYSAHGLRKASLRRLAHAGATGVEMMAVSGHASLDQLQEYLNEVDNDFLADAAMAKLTETKTKTKMTKKRSTVSQSREIR